MLKTANATLVLVIIVLFNACSNETPILKTTNPLNIKVKDAVVKTPIESGIENIRIVAGEKVIPYQIIVEDDKKYLLMVSDFSEKETKEFNIIKTSVDESKEFTHRTYAELSMKPGNVYFDKRFRGDKFVKVTTLKVPAIHTDHDALFKYEGPGWESEKVGYRFYLDWRNATDIFGKKYEKLLLENIGTTDTVAKDDSYHSMQDWGMDIFKVGNSLGIGSIGMLVNGKVNMVSKTDSIICQIPYTGPLEAKIITKYFGWQSGENKYNLEAALSITAGSRLTKCEVEISNNADNLVTGLVKHENTELIKSENNIGWNYLALYGKQTLVDNNDELGIVVFYNSTEASGLLDDENSHIVKLKPLNGKVTYYFAAAWGQEANGIKSANEFKKYINETVQILNNPVISELGNK